MQNEKIAVKADAVAFDDALSKIQYCGEQGNSALFLDNLELKKIPREILELKKLEALYIYSNELSELPGFIFELRNLSTLTVDAEKITRLPRAINKLKRLRYLDLEGTNISFYPSTILECEQLSINKRYFKLINICAKFFSLFAKTFLLRYIQQKVYSYFYNRLNALQNRMDVCGWNLNAGACRRPWNQCCEKSDVCEYLQDSGCHVESLCCKIWLCGPALNYLDEIITDAGHPLFSVCGEYMATRERADLVCRALAVPLGGRCSKEDTFRSVRKKPPMNTLTNRWFDNILLRSRGWFIPVDEAERERERDNSPPLDSAV